MTNYELSFGKIIILQDDIAEVVVEEGVEFNLEMVAEYHEFLLTHMQYPFSLLINKMNTYSYTFEAQQHLAKLSQINAMAVVAYNKATITSTKSLIVFASNASWELKIFALRESALKWLEEKQAVVKKEI